MFIIFCRNVRWGCLLVALILTGCSDKNHDGPSVNSFNGRLVQNGNPITIPADQKVTLRMITSKGKKFGIPIQADGSFKIGEMPIESYSLILETEKGKTDGPRRGPKADMFKISAPFEIKQGQTDYIVELGSDWQPEPEKKAEGES